MIDRYAIIALVRAATTEAGDINQLSEKWDVSPQYIKDVLRGYRDPGKSILKALGYERVILYRKKGEQE